MRCFEWNYRLDQGFQEAIPVRSLGLGNNYSDTVNYLVDKLGDNFKDDFRARAMDREGLSLICIMYHSSMKMFFFL